MPRQPLEHLNPEDLQELLRKVDEAIADGQDLRRKIVGAMTDRQTSPWPEVDGRRKPKKGR